MVMFLLMKKWIINIKKNLLTYFKIMQNKKTEKHSMDFGKKEKVLNYACKTYKLSRPNKVGAVMALIRECQPKTIEEWKKWYFEKAFTESKEPVNITPEILDELGERLHDKITGVVIPEWQAAFSELSLQDCKDYIYNLTINRTFDGFIREKSVVNDGLAKHFPEVKFIESDNDLDHAGDIDYLGFVGEKAFGIQIKPITAKANFGTFDLLHPGHINFLNQAKKFDQLIIVIGRDRTVKQIKGKLPKHTEKQR